MRPSGVASCHSEPKGIWSSTGIVGATLAAGVTRPGGVMRKFRDDLLDWATDEGAISKSVPSLLESYCRFLCRHGLAIRRCNLATETIHPLMHNTRHVWFDRVT